MKSAKIGRPHLQQILGRTLAFALAAVMLLALAPTLSLAGGFGTAELSITIRDKETPRRFILPLEELSGNLVFEDEDEHRIEIDIAGFEYRLLSLYKYIVFESEAPADYMVQHDGIYTLVEYPELPDGYWFVEPDIPPSLALTTSGYDGELTVTLEVDCDPEMISTRTAEIYTAQDLYDIRNDMFGVTYKLMNDIDLSGFNDGEWVPIGDGTVPFSGTFDGQGYEIQNLKVTGNLYRYTGLFGYVYEGTIKNVGITDTNINSRHNESFVKSYAGGIIGVAYDALIENCYNTGSIIFSSFGPDAGGIAGMSVSSIFLNCYNTGDVQASSYYPAHAGGIVGNSLSTVENCYNLGNITAMSVSGDSYAGGIIGSFALATASSPYSLRVENCYNAGQTSAMIIDPADDTNVIQKATGGIIGNYTYSSASPASPLTITNCYYINDDSQSIGKSTGDIIINNVLSLTGAQMKQQASFVGFDFDSVWAISRTVNNGYPYFLNNTTPEDLPAPTASVAPASHTYPAAEFGYAAQAAQAFTVTNTGTADLTIAAALTGGTAFEITAPLGPTTIAANETAAVSVRPKSGLSASTSPYADTLVITDGEALSLSVQLSFTVNSRPGGGGIWYDPAPSNTTSSSSKDTAGSKDTAASNEDSTAAENIPSGDSAAPEYANPYSDVPETAWYAEDVRYVTENGLMTGDNGNFSPDTSMTRAMLVTVLYRLYGSPSVSAEPGFSDIPGRQWYSDAVVWAAANNLVGGVGGNLFAPEDTITRQDMAVLFSRYASFAGKTLPAVREPETFADASEIADYAKQAVSDFNAAGIIGGVGDNKVNPRGETTRAETAALLHRFIEAVGITA
jgi:hypothetical protein